METIDYTFTLEARDIPGTLARVTQIFSRRGCNIQTLQVRPYRQGPWAIIDIDARNIPRPEQIKYQLEKLVDIHSVTTHEHTMKKET